MGESIYACWLKTAGENRNKPLLLDFANHEETNFGELAEIVESRRRTMDTENWENRLVLLQVANSRSWLEAFLTCQAVGAVVVPLDPDVPVDGVKRLCQHLRPCAVWNTGGITMQVGAARLKPASLVKLTSGSTGEPRPLVFGDEEMLADGRNIISTMGLRAEDINLAVIPLGHSYGLGNLVMPLILQGTALVVPADPFPFSISEAICRSRATVFPGVPTILNSLERAEIPKRSIVTIRLFISAGSPLAGEQAQAFKRRFGKVVHNFYGSSETGGIAYDRCGYDTLSGRSLGKPMENVSVEVSATGRLLVRSKAVYRRNNPRRGEDDSAFLLPDLAAILEDGSIALRGRMSRQIKLAGKRLNPAELETILREQPGVEEVFVESFSDQHKRIHLGVAIVSSQPPGILKDALKEKLPQWKIPARWIRLEKFPITARGKPDYRALSRLIKSRFGYPEGG